MRDKLIELIGSTEYSNGSLIGKNFQAGFIEKIADHLIANGVFVPPDDLPLPGKEFVLTALRRQVPQPVKVVVRHDGWYKDYYCPECGKQQKRSWKNLDKGCYCERCGQLLKGDWRDV